MTVFINFQTICAGEKNEDGNCEKKIEYSGETL